MPTVVTAEGGGVVVAIHVSPARGIPMRAVPTVAAEAGKGLVGDRYHGTKHRHVSMQSADDLELAALELEGPIAPELTRRNITVAGIELPTKPGRLVRIGDVKLEAVRIAAPCKLLDDTIGSGAKTALRRRAGTIFRVLTSGTIALGDDVTAPTPE